MARGATPTWVPASVAAMCVPCPSQSSPSSPPKPSSTKLAPTPKCTSPNSTCERRTPVSRTKTRTMLPRPFVGSRGRSFSSRGSRRWFILSLDQKFDCAVTSTSSSNVNPGTHADSCSRSQSFRYAAKLLASRLRNSILSRRAHGKALVEASALACDTRYALRAKTPVARVGEVKTAARHIVRMTYVGTSVRMRERVVARWFDSSRRHRRVELLVVTVQNIFIKVRTYR